MAWSSRRVERLVSRIVYIGLCALVLWAGVGLMNHFREVVLCKDYLLRWQVAVQGYNAQSSYWPEFTGSNHMEYMKALVKRMEVMGIGVPRSDTQDPFIYVLHRLWGQNERLFVLCLKQRIIVYGMSYETFEKLDRYVDGKVDPNEGMVRGRRGKDGRSITAIWRVP